MHVVYISVVRDFVQYARCVKDNPFTVGSELCALDNRTRNEGVPVCYNRFLNGRPTDEDAWYVFCHEDFEVRENLAIRLAELEAMDVSAHESLWGVIGAATQIRFGIYHQWRLVGTVEEGRKNGTQLRRIGTAVPMGTPVETFDCQCVIVHSSLIHRYGLRFDSALTFDLYVEEFCMAAHVHAGVVSRILPFAARHWSSGCVQPRYFVQEAHVNAKYPNVCFTGTSSLVLGGCPPFGRRLTVGVKKLVRKLQVLGTFHA